MFASHVRLLADVHVARQATMAVAGVDHGRSSMEEAVVVAVVVLAASEYRDRGQARCHRHPVAFQETTDPWSYPRVEASVQVVLRLRPGQS